MDTNDLPGSQEKVLLDEQSTANQLHQFFHAQAGMTKKRKKKEDDQDLRKNWKKQKGKGETESSHDGKAFNSST